MISTNMLIQNTQLAVVVLLLLGFTQDTAASIRLQGSRAPVPLPMSRPAYRPGSHSTTSSLSSPLLSAGLRCIDKKAWRLLFLFNLSIV